VHAELRANRLSGYRVSMSNGSRSAVNTTSPLAYNAKIRELD